MLWAPYVEREPIYPPYTQHYDLYTLHYTLHWCTLMDTVHCTLDSVHCSEKWPQAQTLQPQADTRWILSHISVLLQPLSVLLWYILSTLTVTLGTFMVRGRKHLFVFTAWVCFIDLPSQFEANQTVPGQWVILITSSLEHNLRQLFQWKGSREW